MKRIVFFVAFAFVIAGLNVGCANNVSSAIGDIQALSISDIQADPFAFTGEITINGVVSAFSSEDETFFSVKDTSELMICRNLFCYAYSLPVRYVGGSTLPELADLINFSGSFVQTNNGYFFEISHFEVEQNIMGHLTSTRGVQ